MVYSLISAAQRGEERQGEPDIKEQVARLLAGLRGDRSMVITALQQVQRKFGYIPSEACYEIARRLRTSPSEVFGVATFYNFFRLTRPGDHTVKVCLGTACHVKGGQRIMDELSRHLSVAPGGTTQDHKFGLERVACFGSCALAPVVVVDEDVYGRMSPSKAKELLKRYEGRPPKAG